MSANRLAADGAERPIRLIHADDHELFRVGLARLFHDRSDFELIASVTGDKVLEMLGRRTCNILLLDLSMPEMDGLKILDQVRRTHPETRVVVLTMHRDRDYFRACLARGAAGYLLKDDVFETVLDALRKVAGGEHYYSAAIQSLIVEEYEVQHGLVGLADLLSPREQEILRMIARGMMNREIADKLFLSVRTIESHRAKIMRKLKVENVQGLVRFAIDHALI